MNAADRRALDAENQRIIDEAIAESAAHPRTWNGPLLVDGAQRRAEMIEEKAHDHVCEKPLLCGFYL